MSFKSQWHREKLKKKAEKGFRGYPAATLAYYGPDDTRASKVVVGIVQTEGSEGELQKWFSESSDVRSDDSILENISALLRTHAVKSVVAVDGIIGCPHEEGIDYPMGGKCPACPFWANRDRFMGEVLK